MIAVYDYTSAVDILSLLIANKIVTLKIYLDNSLVSGGEYVFSYTTIENYPEVDQLRIKEMFNEKTIQMVVQATQTLSEFITMKQTDNVILFDFDFDITKLLLLYHRAYKKDMKDIINQDSSKFEDAITSLEGFITSKGIYDMKVPDLFIKEAGAKQKAKYAAITYGQMLQKMKDEVLNDFS